jgi:hypothetical protein
MRPLRLYTISTLKAPSGNKRPRRSDCTTARVAEVWAPRASDAIAAVRAQHPQLREVYLVSSAAHLDPRNKNRVLTRADAATA